jgi:hypothetical protein
MKNKRPGRPVAPGALRMDGPQGGGKEGGEEAEGGGAGSKRAHTWLHEGAGAVGRLAGPQMSRGAVVLLLSQCIMSVY